MKPKLYPLVLFLSYLTIMQIVLPMTSSKQDFFYFFTWRLFSFPAKTYVYDLTWDQGKSYLFRDHQNIIKKHSFNSVTLFYLMQKSTLNEMGKSQIQLLKERIHTPTLSRHKLKGSLHDHSIEKKNLNVLKREVFY